MEEKSLHLLALERLQSALDNFDTSFIVSNKLFRLALVSEVLDTTCLFEQLHNAWSVRLPLGQGPDYDVDFNYWKSLDNWNSLIENAQQNVCINDATYSLGNGMISDELARNKKKSFKKNLTSAFKHAQFTGGDIVTDFLKWVENDKSGSLTYGNILFGAIESLICILNKINRLLENPPQELLEDYCIQQKSQFDAEYADARTHIDHIVSSSYPIKRKQNLLRGNYDDLKDELINSGFLNFVGGEFNKYDIEDFRRQNNNQSLSDEKVVLYLKLEEILKEYKESNFERLNYYLYHRRKELTRSAIASFFVYAEIVPLLEAKICEYENIMSNNAGSYNEHNNSSQSSNFQFVIHENIAEEVIAKIKSYQNGKSTPKDVAQPVRAAIEAGVIRRPTYAEYTSVAGFASIPKSSFSDYTNQSKTPYLDETYKEMINDFKSLLQK